MKSLCAHIQSLLVTIRFRLSEPEFCRQVAERRLGKFPDRW